MKKDKGNTKELMNNFGRVDRLEGQRVYQHHLEELRKELGKVYEK